MPLKLFKRKNRNGFVWHYRGKVGEDYLRGTTGTANKADAARFIAAVERKHFQSGLIGPQDLTFPEAVVLYERAGRGQDKRSKMYITRLLQHWGDKRVREMTAGAIRQSAIDIHPNDSGATRNRQVITPTQAIINHCAELERCAPIRVKRFQFERKIKPPVTLEWLDTFCMYAEPATGAMALTMFATGCRISEARRIEWSDIDFTARTILVRDHKTKKQRIAHMPNRLLVALANLPRDAKPFGRPETTIRRAWDAAVATAAEAQEGFVRMTCHSCRHGFATALLRQGKDVATVAKLGGWSSPHQVLATYAHAIDDKTLTEELFDSTHTARGEDQHEQDQAVRKK
jgi:integrase